MATLNARQQRQLNEIFAALQAELRDGVSLEIILTEDECRVDLYDIIGETLFPDTAVGTPAEQISTGLELLREEPVHDR